MNHQPNGCLLQKRSPGQNTDVQRKKTLLVNRKKSTKGIKIQNTKIIQYKKYKITNNTKNWKNTDVQRPKTGG